jgi:hypothetical protein
MENMGIGTIEEVFGPQDEASRAARLSKSFEPLIAATRKLEEAFLGPLSSALQQWKDTLLPEWRTWG